MAEINYKELVLDILDTLSGYDIPEVTCDPENGPSEEDYYRAPLIEGCILRKFDGNYLKVTGFKGNKIYYIWLNHPEEISLEADYDKIKSESTKVYDPRCKQHNRPPVLGSISRILYDYPFLKECSIRPLRTPADVEDAYFEISKFMGSSNRSLKYTVGGDGLEYVEFGDEDCEGFKDLHDDKVREKFMHYFD